MTRLRVPYRGLGMIAAAVASVLSPNAFSQAGRATLIGAPTGQQYCDFSTIATLPSGQVNVTCNTVVPGSPGQLGFTAANFPLAKADAVATVPFNISVQRTGGNTGAASAIVNVTTGPCTPPSQPVTFAAGIGGAALVPLSVAGPNTATCALQLASVTGATEGLLTASVDITPPPPSGGTIIPGCEGKTPTTNFTQHPALPGPGSATYFTETGVGKIHSWPLPKGANGLQYAAGLVGHTASAYPGFYTPDTLRVEWSLSKCPGDVAYASTPEASFTSRGVVYHPCGVESASESGGAKWNGVGASAYCKVPQTEAWFVNLRYTSGCVGACSIVYFWQGS